MQLSKKYLQSTETGSATAALLQLPEKVLQFGTGVLLRGLCDFYVDKANKQGIFNGRVVVVKSTSSGGADEFAQQDGLYTHVIRGVEDGQTVDECIVNASINRVLSAATEWQLVLDCAANPEMKVVISNTTEAGLVFTEDNVHASPPASFPGKLLAFLHRRYEAFSHSRESGLVVIPTELIVNNGDKLKEIVVALARLNAMTEAFIEWIETANDFCNSLVDRIVPGKLPPAEQAATEAKLGYTDGLMIMSEPYSLWAIECARAEVMGVLSFSGADPGVVLAHDITKYRELKLRILNGAHTLSCGLAVLCGFETVKQAMANDAFFDYIESLMLDEIAPALVTDGLSHEEARAFALKVLDRFRNPFIEHKWLSITLQYSLKMLMRNVPNILNWYKGKVVAPKYMALGFAAYLRFMHSHKNEQGQFVGHANGKHYMINDDKAEMLHTHYELRKQTGPFVYEVLMDGRLWGRDLNLLPEFTDAVTTHLENIQSHLMQGKPLAEYLKEVL